MTVRKKYIIDKNFQLKTAFSIIGVVSVVSLVIITSIAAGVVYNNEKINNIYQIEDNIFRLMQSVNISGSEDTAYRSTIERLTENHINNLQNINKLASFNRELLAALIICVVLQGIILFVMIIKITHRISGPVYVMSNYFREIISGKLPDPRPLRDKDELKKFYELFIELVNSLKSGLKK